MIYPEPTFDPLPGETPGQRLVRIINTYSGCSLSNRKSDLAALIGRGVDDGDAVVGIKTNCATYSISALKAAGCPHPILSKPYVNGLAFAWLVQIGNDYGAWVTPTAGVNPKPGAIMWYSIAGTGDDHAETFISDDGPTHGGGGRPDNAITIGKGLVTFSWSRPMHRWLDPDLLQIPVIAASVTDVEPHPEIDGAHV